MRRLRPCLLIIALAAGALASGCVRAEKTRYRQHLSRVMTAQPTGLQTMAARSTTLKLAEAEP